MAVKGQENPGKRDYFKAWEKFGNFTLSLGKIYIFERSQRKEKFRVNMKFSILSFMMKDGDTFLFDVDYVQCVEQSTDS